MNQAQIDKQRLDAIGRLLDLAFIDRTQRVPTHSAQDRLTEILHVIGMPRPSEPITEAQAQRVLDEMDRIMASPSRRAGRLNALTAEDRESVQTLHGILQMIDPVYFAQLGDLTPQALADRYVFVTDLAIAVAGGPQAFFDAIPRAISGEARSNTH